MAILGFQLVSTLIGVSLLSKIAAHFSFTSWLLCKSIFRCRLPADKELLEITGLTRLKSKGKKHRNLPTTTPPNLTSTNFDTFHFPRTTHIKLHISEVNQSDIACLPLYEEVIWLIDFSVCAICVIFVNELVAFIRKPEVVNATAAYSKSTISSSVHTFFHPCSLNLSVVWSLFIVWFSFSALLSVVKIFFYSAPNQIKTDEAQSTFPKNVSEWPLLLIVAFTSFTVAMFCMVFDSSFFDFRISSSYGNLTSSDSFANTPNHASNTLSRGMFQTLLAFIAAIMGVLFVFPGLQFGRVYLQAIRSETIVTRTLFHLNFIAPLFTLLLWVVPLTTHISAVLQATTASGKSSPIWITFCHLILQMFSPEYIVSFRLLACLITIGFRISMTKRHMQVYLKTAQNQMDKLTKEAGHITNREVQRLVASVFHCFNFTALQYLGPTLLILGLTCSYKLTTYSAWITTNPITIDQVTKTKHSLSSIVNFFAEQDWNNQWIEILHVTRAAVGEVFESFRFQASFVCEGIFGFVLWWSLAAWQAVALMGMAYYRLMD